MLLILCCYQTGQRRDCIQERSSLVKGLVCCWKMLSRLKQRILLHLRHWPCVQWRCWKNWRSTLMVLIIILNILVLLVVLPILIWQLQEFNAKPHVQLWFIAGLFMLVTIPVFLFSLLQHLTYYSRPDLQRYIVR